MNRGWVRVAGTRNWSDRQMKLGGTWHDSSRNTIAWLLHLCSVLRGVSLEILYRTNPTPFKTVRLLICRIIKSTDVAASPKSQFDPSAAVIHDSEPASTIATAVSADGDSSMTCHYVFCNKGRVIMCTQQFNYPAGIIIDHRLTTTSSSFQDYKELGAFLWIMV